MTEITNSVEKNVNSGLPYKFRCRWFGKYDEEFNGVSPVGISKSESDLTTYDGLYYDKEAIISPNAIIAGSPTISSDMEVSGFSSTKFLQIQTAFNPASDKWEIYLKVKTGSTSSSLAIPFHSCFGSGASGRYGLAFGIKSGKTFMDISSDGTSWLVSDSTTGTYTYTANTWYWLKIGWSGTEYYIDYSTDGVTYTRDYTFSSSSSVYSPLTRTYIGIYSANSFSNQWTGSIDLSDCYIKTASQFFPDTWTTVWRGTFLQGTLLDFTNTTLPWKWNYQRILKNNLYALASKDDTVTYYGNVLNGTVNGKPLISPDKVMSEFSTDNYLTMLSQWKPSGNPWKIHLRVTTGSGTNDTLFGQSSTNRTTPQLALVNKVLKIYLASSTSAWDISSGDSCSIELEPNTSHDIDVEFTGTAYTISVDGVVGLTLNNSTPVYSGNYPFILGYDSGNNPFTGSVHLGESYIEFNGVEVWRGFSKYSVQGCLNGDEDSGGHYYCYVINGDDHIELQKKTGGSIIAYNTTPRYLGEVDTNVYGYYQVGVDNPNTPV